MYLKALEAVVNLVLRRWYIRALCLFSPSFLKRAHKFDDCEPITCDFLKHWSYVYGCVFLNTIFIFVHYS